jgi:pyruvate formate lyase activating enzyme
MNKREFIKKSLCGAGGVVCLQSNFFASFRDTTKINKWTRESMFYAVTPRGLKCLVCPNECTLKNGEKSTCRNRVNIDNKLYTIAYGNPCAVHVDPIEKKPLFHYLPGSYSYSIATAGCNFACLNCQNYTISQKSPDRKSVV